MHTINEGNNLRSPVKMFIFESESVPDRPGIKNGHFSCPLLCNPKQYDNDKHSFFSNQALQQQGIGRSVWYQHKGASELAANACFVHWAKDGPVLYKSPGKSHL